LSQSPFELLKIIALSHHLNFYPTGKSPFEVNSNIVRLRDLLGHFGKKDVVDFNKCNFY